jgi:HEAT repeat protein
MHRGPLLFLFASLLLLLLHPPAGAASPAAVAADEQTLRTAKLGVDGPALLDFFRQRTLANADRDKILALIRQLGDDDFGVREKAFTHLVALGNPAVPLLRQAIADADAEVVHRAERCLARIEGSVGVSVSGAAARLVAVRKPAGAAEVLLAYLPFADDDNVVDEVRQALAAVTVRDGKAEPTVVKALADPSALKRATAAEALCRAGAAGQRTALLKLLDDPEQIVRLRVGLALVALKERAAVPVLIALLGELPTHHLWQVEDILYRLAGEQAPQVGLGTDADSRQKCRDAWAAWWKASGPRIDLAKLDASPDLLGYTLVVQMDNARVTGRVLEVNKDGKVRWQIEGLQYPLDAHVVKGDKVLIAEYRNNRVTERNFKGEVAWEKAMPMPIAAQRLANGNTFMASRNHLLEVDKDGKEVFTQQRPSYDVMAALKLRDGQIALVTSGGQYKRLDREGKEIKSFPVGNVQTFAAIDVLPNGRVLVPLYYNNKVVEYDAEGKSLWDASVQWPTSAARLPNGNTLVSSQGTQAVMELDRAGKVVWQHKLDGRPWRARRR